MAVNPSKPRQLATGDKDAEGNPVRRFYILAWSVDREGAGWIPIDDLQERAELLSKLESKFKNQTVAKQDDNSKVYTVRKKAEGKVLAKRNLRVRHGQRPGNGADLLNHYLPRNGRCNLCVNLASADAPPVARDVVRVGERLVRDPEVEFKLAPLFRSKAGLHDVADHTRWVFCSVQGDPSRCGWIPLGALQEAS